MILAICLARPDNCGYTGTPRPNNSQHMVMIGVGIVARGCRPLPQATVALAIRALGLGGRVALDYCLCFPTRSHSQL